MLLHGGEAAGTVAAYLERVERYLTDVPEESRAQLLATARARVELELELTTAAPGSDTLATRLGSPASFADALRRQLSPAAPAGAACGAESVTGSRLPLCRTCRHEVSAEAVACPHCGAPRPADQKWNGHGYEWKSRQTLFGLPLVHVAVGRHPNGKLRVAKGIIAIGQFGVGAITIAQFGVGAVFGLGQFVAAPLAIGQFALGLAVIGQFAIGALFGLGMFSTGLKAIGFKTFGNWLSGR